MRSMNFSTHNGEFCVKRSDAGHYWIKKFNGVFKRTSGSEIARLIGAKSQTVLRRIFKNPLWDYAHFASLDTGQIFIAGEHGQVYTVWKNMVKDSGIRAERLISNPKYAITMPTKAVSQAA